MKLPDIDTAEALLREAEKMNPGVWVDHSVNAAKAAQLIAENVEGMNPEQAYVIGLLHDIGRREGVRHLHHVIHGYEYLNSLGYHDAAKICMTHSFIIKDINTFAGKWDCTDKELEFINDYLKNVEYNDYDLLGQLCDFLALPDSLCIIEKRMVDVTMRYGFKDLTIPKWKEVFRIKEYFESKIGKCIYDVLPIKL